MSKNCNILYNAMVTNFPPCPVSFKISAFIKTAKEYDERDIIISYWYATKQPE